MLKWYGKKVLNKVIREADNSLSKSADIVKKSAKEIVPVKTGNLKNSIETVKEGKLKYKVGSDLDYALGIELGSPTRAPSSYLRRSLYNNRAKIIKAFKDIL